MINIFKYIFVLLILSEAIVFPLSPESSLNQKGMLHPTEKDDNLLTKLDIAEFITQLEKFQTLLRECNITYFEDNNPFQQLLEKKEKVEPISHNELKQQFKSAFQKISQLLYGNISKATPLEMLQKLLHKNIALFAPLLYSFSNDSEEFQFEIFRFFVSQDFSSPKVLSETCDLFYQAIDASTLEPKDKDSRRQELTDAILLYLIFNKGNYSGGIGTMEPKIQEYGLADKDPELKEEIRAFLSPPPTPWPQNPFLSKAPLPSKGFFPIYKALLSSVASSDSSEKKAKLTEQLKKIIIPLIQSFAEDKLDEDMLQLFEQISYLLMNYPTYRKIFSEIFSDFSTEKPSEYALFAPFIQGLYKKEFLEGFSGRDKSKVFRWIPILGTLPAKDIRELLEIENILDHTPIHPYMSIFRKKYTDPSTDRKTNPSNISENYIFTYIGSLIHTTNFRSKEASDLFVSLFLEYIKDTDFKEALEFLMPDFYNNKKSHEALLLISQKILERINGPGGSLNQATQRFLSSIDPFKFEKWLGISILSLKENNEHLALTRKLLSYFLQNGDLQVFAKWLSQEEGRMDLVDRAVLKDLLDSFLSSPSSDPQVIQLIKIITRKLINTSLDSESDNEWNNSYKKALELLSEEKSSLISIPEDLQDKAPFLTKLLAFLKRENFDLDTKNKILQDFILCLYNNEISISLPNQATLQELLAPSSCSLDASEKEFYNYFLKLYSQQTVQVISEKMGQNQRKIEESQRNLDRPITSAAPPMPITLRDLPHENIKHLAVCISTLHKGYLENPALSGDVSLTESTLKAINKQLLTCTMSLSKDLGQEAVFFKHYMSLFTKFPKGNASRVCQLTLTIKYTKYLPEGTSLKEAMDTIEPSTLQPPPSLFKLLIGKCWETEQTSLEENNAWSLYSDLLWSWDAPCEARELETYRFFQSNRNEVPQRLLAQCQFAYTSIDEYTRLGNADSREPNALARKKELTKTIFSYITFDIFSKNEKFTEWMKDKIDEYVLKDLTPEKQAAIQRLSSEDSRYSPIAPDEHYISPNRILTPRAFQVQKILINPELTQTDAIERIKAIVAKDINFFRQKDFTEDLMLLFDEISVWTHNKTMLVPIFQEIYDDYRQDNNMRFHAFIHPFIQYHYVFEGEEVCTKPHPAATWIPQEILLPSEFRRQNNPNVMNERDPLKLSRLMDLRYYLALKDFPFLQSLNREDPSRKYYEDFLNSYPTKEINLVGLVDMVNLHSDSDCEFFTDFVFKTIENPYPMEEKESKKTNWSYRLDRWNLFLKPFVEKVKKYPDLNEILYLITKRLLVEEGLGVFPSEGIDFESWLAIIESSPQKEEDRKRTHKELLAHYFQQPSFRLGMKNLKGYCTDNLQDLLDEKAPLISKRRKNILKVLILSIDNITPDSKLNYIIYDLTKKMAGNLVISFFYDIPPSHIENWVTLIASYNSNDLEKGKILKNLIGDCLNRYLKIASFLSNGDINACFLDGLQLLFWDPQKLDSFNRRSILRSLIRWIAKDARDIALLNQNTLEEILQSLLSESDENRNYIALIKLITKELIDTSTNRERPPGLQELDSRALEILIPSFSKKKLSLRPLIPLNQNTLEGILQSLLSQPHPDKDDIALIQIIIERLIKLHLNPQPTANLKRLYSEALKILIPSISNLDSIIFKEESLSLLNKDQLKEMITFCLQDPSMFTAEGFENRIKVILSLNRALIGIEKRVNSSDLPLKKRRRISVEKSSQPVASSDFSSFFATTSLKQTFQFFQKTYLESDYKPTLRTDPIPETFGLLFEMIDSSSLEPASEKTLYYDFFSRYFEKYDSLNYFLDKPSSPKDILAALFDILDNPPSSSYPIENLAKGFKDFWDWDQKNEPKGLLDNEKLQKILEFFINNFPKDSIHEKTQTLLTTIMTNAASSPSRQNLVKKYNSFFQELLQNA